MERIIAFCGLDCAQCPAYVATQANDRPAQEQLLAQWRVQFNVPDMPIEATMCDGCTSKGRHGGYCMECPVRACGVERGVANCAYCPDYACDKLQAFFERGPEMRTMLEEIRRSL